MTLIPNIVSTPQNMFFNPNISGTKIDPLETFFFWQNLSGTQSHKKNLSPKLIDDLHIVGTSKFFGGPSRFLDQKHFKNQKSFLDPNSFDQKFLGPIFCCWNKIFNLNSIFHFKIFVWIKKFFEIPKSILTWNLLLITNYIRTIFVLKNMIPKSPFSIKFFNWKCYGKTFLDP